MTSKDVVAKREAARRWANYANASPAVFATWSYLLAGEADIKTASGSWGALKKLASCRLASCCVPRDGSSLLRMRPELCHGAEVLQFELCAAIGSDLEEAAVEFGFHQLASTLAIAYPDSRPRPLSTVMRDA